MENENVSRPTYHCVQSGINVRFLCGDVGERSNNSKEEDGKECEDAASVHDDDLCLFVLFCFSLWCLIG